MAKDAKKTRKKKKILRWRGILADSNYMMRWMVFVVLLVACVAATFTQLGFIGVPLSNGDIAYVVMLLPAVALCALLIGTLLGALLGVLCGGILLLHSYYMPLDHFELSFINPSTSVIMLGVCGLLVGILFAFVLRNDPSQVKRTIYIAIVSIVMSVLYSVGFVFNALFTTTVDYVATTASSISSASASAAAQAAAEEFAQTTVVSMLLQFGDVFMQMVFTAIAMAVLCWVGDYLARRALSRENTLGLRSVFAAWLGVVVALAFMLTAAGSFAAATVDDLKDAESNMMSEANYLAGQFKSFGDRSNVAMQLIEEAGYDLENVDEEAVSKLGDLFADSTILDGYTVENDGTVIIAYKDMNLIYASNDPRYPDFKKTDEVLEQGMINAIDASAATGKMQRFVLLGATESSLAEGGISDQVLNPEIAYLYAVPFTMEYENNVSLDQVAVIMQPSSMVFSDRTSVMTWSTVSALILMAVVFLIVFQLLNRMVAVRIDEENTALAHITAGELATRAMAGGTKEFESLSEGINTTVDTLRGWIAEAETRMDAELATAKAIQESALPNTFPPYPAIMRFDIFATMDAAREVGGDFYDFFLVGDDCGPQSGKLGFVIADVSGKGVPAALFMMKAKALLRDYVSSGLDLGEAVSEANRQLVDGNDEGMFVTAWVGVLDYGTWHVDYVNAGHNPPLLWQRDGGWRWLREKSGPVLGLFDVPYRGHEVQCAAGDMFLLYTDGVTEAFDVNEKLYGEDRLLAVAEEGYRLHPRELLQSVRDDVAVYAEGAEQSDDITILTLEVGVPPEVTSVLVVPAELNQLDRVNSFLHAELDARLCPRRTQNQLDIAVEELFVNVCHYAYAGTPLEGKGKVRIQRTYSADPQGITVDIIDGGVPFDPLAKPDAVTPDNIADVPIGGLGILMAKKSVDGLRYERAGDSNVVTIVKQW